MQSDSDKREEQRAITTWAEMQAQIERLRAELELRGGDDWGEMVLERARLRAENEALRAKQLEMVSGDIERLEALLPAVSALRTNLDAAAKLCVAWLHVAEEKYALGFVWPATEKALVTARDRVNKRGGPGAWCKEAE